MESYIITLSLKRVFAVAPQLLQWAEESPNPTHLASFPGREIFRRIAKGKIKWFDSINLYIGVIYILRDLIYLNNSDS